MQTITKESKLENLSFGEVVKLKGISNNEQNQGGLIEFYDTSARLAMIATRESSEEIHVSSYFLTSFGIKKGSKDTRKIARIGSKDYDELDKKLREVGL